MKFSVWACALACGLIWGLGLFALTLWVILWEGYTNEVTAIGHIYRGYRISALGSLWGLLLAFCDGFIGGLIFAWLYNLLSGRPRQTAT